MANFTITVSNSMCVFGPAPTFWGVGVWGTSKWGDGSESLPLDVLKFIDNAATLTDTVVPQASIEILLSESISLASDLVEESLKDAAGYSYVFVGPSTDAEKRNLGSFTSVTNAQTVWSTVSTSTTSWGES